jgi:hypothetical protein
LERGDAEARLNRLRPADSNENNATRRSFLLSLSAAPLAWAGSWEEKEFPNWPSSFTDRLLTDSPWARPVTVPFVYQPPPDRMTSDFRQIEIPSGVGVPRPAPRGSGWPGSPIPGRVPGSGPGTTGPPIPVRTEAYLTIRWSSALPIRQALALREFGVQGLQTERAVEMLTREDPEYVVEIFGFPTALVTREAGKLEQGLAKTAKLYRKGGKPIGAASVRVPEYGMHLAATLRFPRMEELSPDDGVLNLYAEGGTAKIDQAFKLRPMVYHGKLEL